MCTVNAATKGIQSKRGLMQEKKCEKRQTSRSGGELGGQGLVETSVS